MRKTVTTLFAFVFSLAVFLLALGAVSAQSLFPPSAPLNVTAVAGDSQAVISFYPPRDNGGSPVTDYVVSGPSPLAPVTVPAPATSYTYSGLTNGNAYTFSVAAKNAVGTSPFAPANSVTPSKGSTFLTPAATVHFSSPDATSVVVTGQISGITDPDDLATVKFAYGLTKSYEIDAPTLTLDGQNNFTLSLKGLKSGSTYYGQVVYTNLTTLETTGISGQVTFVTNGGTSSTGLNGGSTGGSTSGGDGTSVATNPNDIRIRLDNPLGATRTLPDFLLKVLDAAILLLTPVVVMMLLYSGFLFVSARGNIETLSSAKQALLHTLIGAAIVLGAKGLALVIQSAISCIAGAAGC